MSSIGEAKEKLAAASVSADEAKTALGSVGTAIDEAVEFLNEAAAGSDHEKVAEALTAYQDAVEKFEDILALIEQGQLAANEYAEGLG